MQLKCQIVLHFNIVVMWISHFDDHLSKNGYHLSNFIKGFKKKVLYRENVCNKMVSQDTNMNTIIYCFYDK